MPETTDKQRENAVINRLADDKSRLRRQAARLARLDPVRNYRIYEPLRQELLVLKARIDEHENLGGST
jgi:hypothetical protein